MLNKLVRFEVAVWRFKLVTMSNKQAPNRMWNWRVISIGESEKVTIFFLRGGKRIFYGSSPDLEQVDSHHRILELARSVN
jgi:hypothetical protein